MLTKHISVILLTVCLILIIRDVKTIRNSGPYVIMPTRIGACEDVGTDQIRYGSRMSRQGNGMLKYTNNVTFDVPWDDKLQMHCEYQQLKNGVYISKFIMETLKNCEYAWNFGQTLFKSFFGAAGYNMTKCPLPAGTYFVKDWNINIQFNNLPSLYYGSYKMIISFSKDKKRVGCYLIFADIVPK